MSRLSTTMRGSFPDRGRARRRRGLARKASAGGNTRRRWPQSAIERLASFWVAKASRTACRTCGACQSYYCVSAFRFRFFLPRRKADDLLTKVRKRNSRGGRSLRNQTELGHSRQRIGFETIELPAPSFII